MVQPVTAPTSPSPEGEAVAAPTPQSANDNDRVTTPPRAAPPGAALNDNDIFAAPANFNTSSLRPPHTLTQQTLSPTSEFMRYFLAALPSRYVLRGLFKTIFSVNAGDGMRGKLYHVMQAPGRWMERNFYSREADRSAAAIKNNLSGLESGFYGASLTAGSMALTHSYSQIVIRDITNLFAETVAEELGKPVDEITFKDIKRSQNKIVQKTVENFRIKRIERFGTDLLFLPAALLREEGVVDFALGIKGLQLFADTWKRKTTMFEDLVTFINNKINPRNGLGQPISQGEVFDLYQHYADTLNTVPMFTNVVERGTGEGVVWAKAQPIFARITELMNETYAYKHNTRLDPKTGHAIHQADFTLPKFISLLGQDFIDPRVPERSLAYIEIANQYGMNAARDAQKTFAAGASVDDVLASYKLQLPTITPKLAEAEKNGIIHKGSTLQLDAAPQTHIDKSSVRELAPLVVAPGQAQTLA